MSWIKEYHREIRWTVVVLVLAVLGVVALWPRDPGPAAPAPPAAQSAQPPWRDAADGAELAALRKRAALPPCPGADGGSTGPAGLSGATGTCLADSSAADLGRAVADRPTLINVWATWCAPCREELPVLQRYAESPGSLQVIGVQVQSGQDDGLRMLADLGVHLPMIHDGGGSVSAALHLPMALPASYVVTGSGDVRRIDPPVVFESVQQVHDVVRRTLEAGA